MSSKSDEELIKEYRAGDARAFQALVSRYLTPLYNFIFLYVRNEGDAEDVAQDAFVSAWKNLRSFDTDKKFKTWLFAIAKNASLNWLKRKKPVVFADLARDEQGSEIIESTVSDELSPEVIFELKSTADELNGAIRALSPHYQTVVVLHHVEELTFREIAELSGESVDTVKSRYRRALILLRKNLAK